MWTTWLVHALVLGASVAFVVGQITVCQEEDSDLRVDCQVNSDTMPSSMRLDYEFSMARGGKETIINTNISGIMADDKFRRDKAYAELLDTDAIRLTITDYTVSENTTFLCKISGSLESVFIEPELLEPCSAISVFMHSLPLLLPLLLSVHLCLPSGLVSL